MAASKLLQNIFFPIPNLIEVTHLCTKELVTVDACNGSSRVCQEQTSLNIW